MSDRAILVTGASTGIGNATARKLAETGYAVFAGVRTRSDAEALAAAGENIRPVILDVTDADSVSCAVGAVEESRIPLYGLLNNAGIAGGGPLQYLPPERLRQVFDVNVFGTMAVTQAAIPLLRAARGRIVTVGSIASRFGSPFVGPYAASKAALAVLMDALRMEMAPFGVSVSLFEFAAVKTPIWSKGRAHREELGTRYPAQALEDYGRWVDAIMKTIDAEEKHGMEPSVVAAAIAEAFATPKPKARYVIGKRAKIQAAVALLPHATRDALVRRAIGLEER
ncbi:MAG TPA: SDR family NAD(P)-dependent oxidoreductase [Candidatus Acidoferrales bacterium]|nr:SDR family NAD(P)-dependent oxidoreductase [Candidatus Acidoferrales bacterium]